MRSGHAVYAFISTLEAQFCCGLLRQQQASAHGLRAPLGAVREKRLYSYPRGARH